MRRILVWACVTSMVAGLLLSLCSCSNKTTPGGDTPPAAKDGSVSADAGADEGSAPEPAKDTP